VPVHPHHTFPPASEQLPPLLADAWLTDVLPQLPADLIAQAHSLKAFQRIRGLASPTLLLRALLAFVLADHSFRSLGAWALLIGLAELSEAAWRKRLLRSALWLDWLLSALLAAAPSSPPATHRRVRLIDATCLAQTGGPGDAWRVHWDYELCAGRLGSVRLTDRSQGEHLNHFLLAADDIIVADSGYGYRRSLAALRAAGADGVLRFHPTTCPLEDEQGQSWDAVAWLRASGSALGSWNGWCRLEDERLAVRVVAVHLPPEQAQKARKRKQARARERKRRPAASTKVLAGWVLLLTTLSAEEWPAEAVAELYRARWQIELVFKRLKQLLRVRALRCRGREMAEATVRALLIGWVLQEQLGAVLGEALERKERCPVSSWRLCQLSLETLRQEVVGRWSRARLRACLPRLGRYLCTSRRRRAHQESQLRAWLARHPGMAVTRGAS
jgi:hypothetical protein